MCLSLCNTTGDVGDDGSVAGKVAGVVVEFGEGVEIDADVDDATGGCVVLRAAQQVEVDIGSELVDGPILTPSTEGSGDLVDTLWCGHHPVGWDVHPEVVRRPGVICLDNNSALFDGAIEAAGGLVGFGFDTQAAEPCAQLAGRVADDVAGDPVDDAPCSRVVEVRGAVEQDPCPAHVEDTRLEHVVNLGESRLDFESDPDFGVGTPAGEIQRCADLGCRGFSRVPPFRFVVVQYVDGGSHIRIHRCRVVGHQPLVGAQHHIRL